MLYQTANPHGGDTYSHPAALDFLIFQALFHCCHFPFFLLVALGKYGDQGSIVPVGIPTAFP